MAKKGKSISYLVLMIFLLGLVAYALNLGGFRDTVESARSKQKGKEVKEKTSSGSGNNIAANKDEEVSGDNNSRNDNNTPVSVDNINTESLEIPASSYRLTRHKYYALGYDEKHEQAAWVAYKLEARETRGRTKREDDFRPDPEVTTNTARPSDYSKSGHDRGHLAPAADFKFSKRAMSESFFMSNMSPQKPRFNRGIWKMLEERVRAWVKKDKAYYIVTGPVLKGKRFRKIGRKTRVSIPKYYYKILLDLEEPEVKAIAFLMENKGSDKPLSSFVVAIDKIEEMTGLDFFPNLPDDLEKKLEASTSLKGWKFRE